MLYPGVLRVRPLGPPACSPAARALLGAVAAEGPPEGPRGQGWDDRNQQRPSTPAKPRDPRHKGQGRGGETGSPPSPTQRGGAAEGDALLRLHPRASRSSSALCTARFEFAAYSQAGGTSRAPQQHFGVGIVPSEFEDLPRE